VKEGDPSRTHDEIPILHILSSSLHLCKINLKSSSICWISKQMLTGLNHTWTVWTFGLPPASTGFWISLPFNPEDGGILFLQTFGVSPNYTALEYRRPYSTQSLLWELQIQQRIPFNCTVVKHCSYGHITYCYVKWMGVVRGHMPFFTHLSSFTEGSQPPLSPLYGTLSAWSTHKTTGPFWKYCVHKTVVASLSKSVSSLV
jgi:hypothetical protein